MRASLDPHGDAADHEYHGVGLPGKDLVASSGQITEKPSGEMIGNDAQPDLVADEDNCALT
jgi:hypothetical protein